jgi:hypothetical protein
LLREYLEIRQKTLPAGHWQIAVAESQLGGCLTLADRYEEAEALLLRSHDVLNSLAANPTPAQRNAIERNVQRAVQLYEAWDKPEQAARWRAKLPTTQPATEPSDHSSEQNDS